MKSGIDIKRADGRSLPRQKYGGVSIQFFNLIEAAIWHLKETYGEDVESIMAGARYVQASGLTREVPKRPELKKTELTERIDRIAHNRFLGIPLFLAAMWIMFKFTSDVSKPFPNWISAMTSGPFKR